MSDPRNFKISKFVATAAFAANFAFASQVPPKLIESVRLLGAFRVTLDLCLMSPDFRKLADATQRQTISISNRLDGLTNDLHESPKGKMLFISYSMSVSQHARSAEFRQKLVERRGGICDFKLIEELEAELKRNEPLIRKQV